MDAPWIGFLFRNETNRLDRTELLLTITPYVIRNREESENVTAEFEDRIRGFREIRRALSPVKQRRFEAPGDETQHIPVERQPELIPPEEGQP